ncbi:MAG: VWA domain-containing protein, partial [Acidimicrobiia bacterium]
LGATDDRLVGSLDVAAALGEGRRRFQPGLLAEAHGGVLYVVEVYLLADHLVDVLLDVAASGMNVVEREGLSESHPARFVLAGSMNPEEGDLRPQLLDRFGLAVDVASIGDPGARAEAVRRRLAFDADPAAFAAAWAGEEERLRAGLAAHRPAALPAGLLGRVSALCASVGAEGLRADLVICRAAAALAGWEGEAAAGVDHVRRVAPLALAHRRRRSPFEEPGVDQGAIEDALDGPAPPERRPPPGAEEAGGGPGGDGRGGGGAERRADPGAAGRVVPVRAARTRSDHEAGGRRSVVEGPRGRTVGDRVPDGPPRSVAAGATLRAAAERVAVHGGPAAPQPGDVREAVREQRAGNLLVLTVDASGAMGAARRMEAVKGAVVSLLLDAYQRRDRVALVAFRGEGAEVVLRPTGSVEVASARLAGVVTGGRTPLAAGLEAALGVCTAAAGGSHRPLLVLVSDGRATAAPAGAGDPVAAAHRVAAAIAAHRIDAVVVDAEEGRARLGLARALADAMGARYLALPELTTGALSGALREVLP